MDGWMDGRTDGRMEPTAVTMNEYLIAMKT